MKREEGGVQVILEKLRKLDKGEFEKHPFEGDKDIAECFEIIDNLVDKLKEQENKELEYEKRFLEIDEVLNSYLLHDYSKEIYVSEKGDIVDSHALSVNLFGKELEESIRVVERQKEQILASSVSRSEVEKANEEIKTLLKEVHHRVKNNLQVITSLIGLQSSRLEDEGVGMIFKDLQNRIASMAIVHELLYQSEDLSKINYKDYLVSLTEKIIASFNFSNKNVKVNIEASDIWLNIDTSIPLGLFINEIVTNSLKYAFIDKNKGLITIRLTKKENYYVLVIEDDGKGFDVDNQTSPETLGLKLIKNLAKQLNGVLEKESDKGVKYILKFKELEVY